ncbi:M42 glutamyl aminopeptidase [Rubripirellula amarantea]|uniref:M42 glutamyl aminopeptidase n=1 Tax=Rubripirellula amarantea TaxID=2527999 RepID=A0A5C5WHN4_9BACT|nr:peptidase M42 [Rubripirellula amarantea]TWT49595.1 M42 glutamyl aminopeptidase [Rubripirellula amarantea]
MENTHRSLQSFLHLLRALVREPSVVGMEDAFFRVLRRELEEFPVTVTRYHGLLVVQGNKPESAYVSAHVDRHGLMCTGPREFQYAAFIAGNRGELNGDSISEQFMETIAGRFYGQRVQAHTPYAGSYLGQGVITESFICPRRKNLIFEIEGLDFLQPGTPVSFLDRLKEEDGHISAQLDNVVSVAVVIELIRRGFQGTALFTAGEESGRSWRYAAEWFQRRDVSTDRLIVLDTSPFPNIEDLADQDVVLRHCDSTAKFDPGLTQKLADTCDRMGISYRYKDDYINELNKTRDKPSSLGRTELGRLISASNLTITGTTLQLPTSSYHTQTETASISSVDAMLRVLSAMAGLGSAERSHR